MALYGGLELAKENADSFVCIAGFLSGLHLLQLLLGEQAELFRPRFAGLDRVLHCRRQRFGRSRTLDTHE
ncbi:hypothetical protein D3C72_1459750 [compost metagenome]